MDKDKKQDSEPLSFEADFTRHIFSLFASLYDSRASPYIGPMPPTEEAPVEEEDDLESEPPFASSLCDFRLRTAYQNEVDSRPQVLEEMAAKAETIQGNASNPDAPKELILGERLPARLASGKTSEIELRKQRLEAIEKSRRCAELRKDRENEERRKRAQKVLDVDRRERKDILAHIRKLREADFEARHERAAARRRAMEKRRKEMEERRQQEFYQTEEARKAVMSISYRSPRGKEVQRMIGDAENEQRAESIRQRQARWAAGEAARQRNMTIKTVPREHPTEKFKLGL